MQKKTPLFLINGRVYDPVRRTLTNIDGSTETLRSNDCHVLDLLIENKNNVVTRQQILDTVWKDKYVTDNSLNSSVMKIRKALNDKDVIKSISGVGYEFVGTLSTEFEEVDATLLDDKAGEEIKVFNQTHATCFRDNYHLIILSVIMILFDITVFIDFEQYHETTKANRKYIWLSPFTAKDKNSIENHLELHYEDANIDKTYLYLYQGRVFYTTKEGSREVKRDTQSM